MELYNNKIALFVTNIPTKILDASTKIKSNSDELNRFLKIGSYTLLLGIQRIRDSSSILTPLKTRIDVIENVIGTFQIAADFNFLVNQKYKNKDGSIDPLKLFGGISFFTADVGGACMWLNELKILDLAKCTSSIGRIPVFGKITRVGLGTAVNGVAALGYLFFGMEALNRLRKAENGTQRNQAMIDATWCASGIALKTFVLAGCTNMYGFVALGILSASLGLTSFLYGQYHAVPVAPSQTGEISESKETAWTQLAKDFKARINDLAETFAETDLFLCVAKMAVSAFDLAKIAFQEEFPLPLSALRGEIKLFADFCDGIGLIERINEFVCPEKGKTKPFWLNKQNSKAKVMSKVLLLGNNVCSSILLLGSWGLLDLAKLSINLSTVGIAKNVFTVGSSFCAIVDSGMQMKKDHAQVKIDAIKIRKWTAQKEALANFQNPTALDEIGRRYISAKQELDSKTNSSKPINCTVKWDNFLKKYKGKTKDYTKKIEALKHNQKIGKNRNILGIVSNTSKVAIGAFAITVAVLSLTGTPFTVTLLSLGLLVGTLGYAKSYYEKKYKPMSLKVPIELLPAAA
jgi:hypothetical protein